MKISDQPPPVLLSPSPGSLTTGAFRDMKFGIEVEISYQRLSVCKTNVDLYLYGIANHPTLRNLIDICNHP